MKTRDKLPTFPNQERQSYEPVFFNSLASVEDKHFWFRSRNRIIDTLIRQIAGDYPSGYRVLEIGCGTGNTLRVLEQACPNGLVIGADIFIDGLRFARQRTSCPLLQADMHAFPMETNFNLVCLFDVIEHLPNDEEVLRNLYKIVAPGGVLFLTVPAHQSLWSYFDEASHHCRRYGQADLQNKLTAAGFRVDFISQFMAVLYPLMWFSRRLKSQAKRKDELPADRAISLAMSELKVHPLINKILSTLLKLEAPIISKRIGLPVGTSLLALAYKPLH